MDRQGPVVQAAERWLAGELTGLDVAAALAAVPADAQCDVLRALRRRGGWAGWWRGPSVGRTPRLDAALRAEEAPAELLAVLAAHPNGHVREEALRRLSDRGEAVAGAAALVGADDHVDAVRAVARASVARRPVAELAGWAAELARPSVRDGGAAWREVARARLAVPAGWATLLAVVRRGRADHALAALDLTAAVPLAARLAAAAQSTSPFVRLAAVELAREGRATGALTARTRDRSARVRARAWEALDGLGAGDVVAWRAALLDPSAGVRSVAVCHLRPAAHSTAAWLLAQRPAGSARAAWLWSLHGLGADEASDAALSALHDASPRVRSAALGVLVARELVDDDLLERCALDPSGRVAWRAIGALGGASPEVANRIAQAGAPPVRVHAVLCRAPFWSVAAARVRLAGGDPAFASRLGDDARRASVEAWRWPTPAQRRDVEAAVAASGRSLPGAVVRAIVSALHATR